MKVIDLGEAIRLEALFNDGQGDWDNNGRNYFFPRGVWTCEGNGVIRKGRPE